ncbi:MAG: polysaccharide deacetylase family protein [Oscillibacter sp.]|nr:polysaccharide deacetylase family protein [Oscillibacter sp.]
MEKRILLFLSLSLISLTACGTTPVAGPAEMAEDIKYVALTFDDGPRKGTTDRLLNGLRDRDASATFFLVGEQIEANQELVARMRDEGHQIGNHTWSHQRLADASPALISQEVGRTEEILESLLGGGEYWLRPPYGLVSPGSEDLITVPMVKWSVDPRDWESRDTEKVVQAVLQDVRPNSIILLHDIYPTSVDAALRIVDVLAEKGYWFVTVEELLLLNGIAPQAGAMYRNGNP